MIIEVRKLDRVRVFVDIISYLGQHMIAQYWTFFWFTFTEYRQSFQTKCSAQDNKPHVIDYKVRVNIF